MKINSLKLTNVGRFNDITVHLAPLSGSPSRVTVFVGINGAGKTTLLKALTTCLSWLIARIRTRKGNGSHIAEEDIRNGTSAAIVSIAVAEPAHPRVNAESDPDEEDDVFVWGMSHSKQEGKTTLRSSLEDVNLLADHYRTLLTADDNASLPLIAYYPVERSVLEIPLKIKSGQTFDQLAGYDDSLKHSTDFRRFFEWFREREDSENESGISDSALNEIAQKLGAESEAWKTLSNLKASSRDSQLTAARSAIAAFMPGYTNLRVQRKPRLHMAIDKDGVTFNVAQLSQGEKSMLALTGDIARRLAMMNPSMGNPLHGEGIVLIDEVDLHLHPEWQINLIQRLSKTFPNCQFVLTTQSPLVIADAKEALVYALRDGELHEFNVG
ncbi:ATP-binding cassette domain-containing protein [Pseudomonas kribbensis]|uniref:ATP-binding cassette domain-containing protein n=1 Tax=Pseudomonas kribbensis TaxID=1628086 RepID=A0A4Y8VGA6_9PSED|nr:MULTISPECIES: AAA family ATPase [Pseudomonas]TFH79207.1 ATP-binding cassette domain-containing protein [Pseudomonas kribbensis]